ncbi:Zinc finger protein CONSTANS-LIKE 16 [Linum grandiflorum]
MSSRRKSASAKAAAIRAASSSSGKQPRSKTKKPKYLSLKLQLNHKASPEEPQIQSDDKTKKKKKKKKKRKRMTSSPSQNQQLNLFPLYPEETHHDPPNADIDDEIHGVPDDHVAILLESSAADTSTSLHGLLDSTTTAAEEDPSSPNYSLFRGGGGRGGGESHHGFGSSADSKSFEESSSWLVRTAMRCRERDPSEERWVSYCQVVEEQQQKNNNKKKKMKKKMMMRLDHDEVTSDPLGVLLIQQKQGKKLVGLKLDYQEILDAWSDKGSLYIDNDRDLLPPPQTVPDLQDSDDPTNQGGMVEDSGNVWRVPEMEEEGTGELGGTKDVQGYCWKQREASVLRYKEKRQNRLFSKRIRYQVRKLNAEKRPRLKGRFVKRIGE